MSGRKSSAKQSSTSTQSGTSNRAELPKNSLDQRISVALTQARQTVQPIIKREQANEAIGADTYFFKLSK